MKHAIALVVSLLFAGAALAATFTFTTGAPDGRMAMASRPASTGKIEIEAADDFIISGCTTSITSASFTGLMPSTATIAGVDVEIYRIFPVDSDTTRTITVPTRTNSPSDVAFDSRTNPTGMSFSSTILAPTFAAANSVLNNISAGALGDGPVSLEEVRFDVTFTTPLVLPAGHYFFVPQVALSGATDQFFWLSAPILQFPGDLQVWMRNATLAPDWLRVGTDIVGGTTFNASFSLSGTTVPIAIAPSSASPLSGVEGSALSATFIASGGTGPYTFSETGALPAGVTLSTTGTLAGTPSVPGSFPVTITATDAAGCSSSIAYTITIADAPLTASGVTVAFTPGTPFTTTVATFHDPNTAAPASQFTATITWGDGASSPGTIASSGGGNFSVSGTHTYASSGPFTITIAIADTGGSTATATAQAVNALSIPTLAPWMLALLAIAIVAAAVRAFRV